jgi:hypothetical protein
VESHVEMKIVASVLLDRPTDELMVCTFDGVPGVGTHNGASVVSFLDISSRINTATADLPPELEAHAVVNGCATFLPFVALFLS